MAGVEEPDRKHFKLLNRTIRKVTADIENLQYNTAIAALMELLNALGDLDPQGTAIAGFLGGTMAKLLGPFAPHLAEELWAAMGGEPSVFTRDWPAWDEAACVEEEVVVAVQVKGRLRGRVTVSKGAAEEEVLALALADPNVKRHVPGREAVRKVIFVPDKILNLFV